MTENEKELVERLEASNQLMKETYHNKYYELEDSFLEYIRVVLINNENIIKKVKDEDTEENI